ncbi:hypothetical protein V8F20_012205 [Naviculisporaceae sp. PSN 640]
MARAQEPEALLDMEEKLIADTLAGFRGLVLHSAEKVDNVASTGEAGYNAMAVEIMMHGLVKSVEDLLALTRRLRELWAVGPLKKPGEGGEAEALNEMRQNAASVFQILDQMREEKRQRMVRQSEGGLAYVTGAVEALPSQTTGS